MNRFLKLLVVLAVGLVSISLTATAASAAPQSASASEQLTTDLNSIFADPTLKGAQTAAVVKQADTGKVLYSRQADESLIPSSNAKLYTSAAALQVLGPDYRFSTTVSGDHGLNGPLLKGNLYLRGTGDPTLGPQEIDSMAAAIASRGIQVVTGNVVGDDTFFDTQRSAPGWEIADAPFSYQPETSALTVAADKDYDVGSLEVQVRPGASNNAPPLVQTVPATSYVKIVNSATTGAVGSTNTLQVVRRLGTNTIDVSGNVPQNSGVTSVLSTVSDPTSYAATLFREALARHHVLVVGGISTGKTPSDSLSLTQQTSQPLSTLLNPLLKQSNNGIADILAKAMGQKAAGQGTWKAGIQAEASTLGSMGVDVNKIKLVDGSGLSRMDLVSAQQTTNLLQNVQARPWFPVWYDALPVAGDPRPNVGGTLSTRMIGSSAAGNAHAKTGSATGLSALSGYVADADGKRLGFSIIENNYLSSDPKAIEDKVVERLASFSEAKPVSAG